MDQLSQSIFAPLGGPEEANDVSTSSSFAVPHEAGLSRTSIGTNVLGAMKGYAGDGIEMPHPEKRFPGYDAEKKEFRAEVSRNRIFGGEGPGAFRARLDAGLSRPSIGANVFGAMKGYADGGGDAEEKEFSAEVNRNRIRGQHVAEYTKSLQDEEAYKTQFSPYIRNGTGPDNIGDMYKKAPPPPPPPRTTTRVQARNISLQC